MINVNDPSMILIFFLFIRDCNTRRNGENRDKRKISGKIFKKMWGTHKSLRQMEIRRSRNSRAVSHLRNKRCQCQPNQQLTVFQLHKKLISAHCLLLGCDRGSYCMFMSVLHGYRLLGDSDHFRYRMEHRYNKSLQQVTLENPMFPVNVFNFALCHNSALL